MDTTIMLVYVLVFIGVISLLFYQAIQGKYSGIDFSKIPFLDNTLGIILQILVGLFIWGGFFYLARLIVAPLSLLQSFGFQGDGGWISLLDITYGIIGLGMILLVDNRLNSISKKHSKTD